MAPWANRNSKERVLRATSLPQKCQRKHFKTAAQIVWPECLLKLYFKLSNILKLKSQEIIRDKGTATGNVLNSTCCYEHKMNFKHIYYSTSVQTRAAQEVSSSKQLHKLLNVLNDIQAIYPK